MPVVEVEYDRSNRTPCTNMLFTICGLNVVQVREIRVKLEAGELISSLAKEYGVDWQAIVNVRDGRIFGNAK